MLAARAIFPRCATNRGKCKFVSWDKRFVDPIAVPGRKPLVTLRDAATFITKLPKAEHDADEWQAAMFAPIGGGRALNRHVEREFNSSRKDTHWGGRKLARDR